MMAAALRTLFYVALGPIVGLLAASLAIGIATFATSGSLRDFSGWDAGASAPLLIAAYTLGLLPALLTAIVSLVIARRVAGWPHWLWAGFSGGVIASTLAWLVFGLAPIGAGLQPVTFTVVIASAGAVAGFVCASLFDGIAALAGRR